MSSPRVKESDVDVLVIGAGPAGLMCANGLAKAGVNVRVVDKKCDKVAAGHADAIQPRTIEVLQSYGLAEQLLQEACQMHTAASYNQTGDAGIVRTSRAPVVMAPTARYSFVALLNQGAIEAIFLDSLKSTGLTVDRSIIPTSLDLSNDEQLLKDPNAHAVKVLLKHLDAVEGQVETEIVHAKFVIGADGAHSWVRKSLEIAMNGAQTDFVWGVVDMIPETNFPDIRACCLINSNEGQIFSIPRERDMVRLYIQILDNALGPSTGRVDRNKISPERLIDLAKKSFYPYTLETLHSLDWWTIYQIGQRVADKFSVSERVFIIGDACHTHSPHAGQGMNAAINDAHNLSWKITQVLRGWSDMSLLKTYEVERRKYAQDLIAFDRELSECYSTEPQTRQSKDSEHISQKFQTYSAFISGISVQYAESAIVDAKHQSFAKNLIVGQRILPQILIRAADARPYELQDLLPADMRFKVLIFAGDTTEATQHMKVSKLAEAMDSPESFLWKHAPGNEWNKVFDIFTISSVKKELFNYTDLPKLFRSHWSKVFVDDLDMNGKQGGKAYKSFGIEPAGAIIIIRPDGYIGFISSFECIHDVDSYFASFMTNL